MGEPGQESGSGCGPRRGLHGSGNACMDVSYPVHAWKHECMDAGRASCMEGEKHALTYGTPIHAWKQGCMDACLTPAWRAQGRFMQRGAQLEASETRSCLVGAAESLCRRGGDEGTCALAPAPAVQMAGVGPWVHLACPEDQDRGRKKAPS